jgi:hypothetical protein
MKLRGGDFSTGTMGNFQSELTVLTGLSKLRDILNAVSLYFIRESIGGAGGNRSRIYL